MAATPSVASLITSAITSAITSVFTSAFTSAASTAVVARTDSGTASYWTLRVGAALCFIGHGAFGFIAKQSWVPYFGVVGIPEGIAWQMMPWVGAVDITVGMAVLFAPRRIPLVYMAVWALWTALLRPLSGESFFETLERAGNYGVPLALLLMSFGRDAAVRRTLQVATVLLLAGHGALQLLGKPVFAVHYATVGLGATLVAPLGWFELALAVAIAARPLTPLLFFACAWKLATELLWVSSGAPVWEFVERAGSYAAPLALALLQRRDAAVEVTVRTRGSA
jgi:hypothetical protein